MGNRRNRTAYARGSNSRLQEAISEPIFARAYVLPIIMFLLVFPTLAAGPVAATPQTVPADSATTRQDPGNEYKQGIRQVTRDDTARLQNEDYRIGPEDLLEISVYGASDLNRTVRVSSEGVISLPLAGALRAAGLTSRELEEVIEEFLRRNYMTDPQVTVFVKEIESHSVAVFGAVNKPGIYQLRVKRSLLEVLSMAQGLASDAGDKVIVVREGKASRSDFAGSSNTSAAETEKVPTRGDKGILDSPGAGSGNSMEIDLKDLLSSANPAYNVEIHPGDVIKVLSAGIVYVVGEVKKPGGFLLHTNENISVLQALALAGGATSTSRQKAARIIRTDRSGRREEIPIDLKKILAGKQEDPILLSQDILFVPNSTGKSAFYRGAEAAVSITSGLIVYRW